MPMEQKRSPGRPRQFAGRVSVHMPTDMADFVEREAKRRLISASCAARQLIAEAIEARQKAGKRR